jgi:hypothetical protein
MDEPDDIDEMEEELEDIEPTIKRKTRRIKSQESVKIGVTRTYVPRNPSDFLSLIRTAINSYHGKVDSLRGDVMFDVVVQRDMARECVLDVDNVLGMWRNWRGANK